MLRFIALICLSLGMSFQQASAQSSNKGEAQCGTGRLTLSNLNALKLPDGENVVGMLETEAGRLEARVSVKNGEVSDPDYYLRDKRLEKTPDAKISKSILACSRGKQSSAGQTLIAKLANSIVQSAEAANGCVARVKWVKCDEIDLCCAFACCGSICARQCAKY
jgi:hypothetical protein